MSLICFTRKFSLVFTGFSKRKYSLTSHNTAMHKETTASTKLVSIPYK
uniref:Uncharacterized protein n=1 Tax=Anopheles funestus TaxID=62324 RepID=A0A182S3Q5_ANOFN